VTTRRPSVTRALNAALRQRQPDPGLAATVALAKRLAGELDDTEDPELAGKLSARLLPVLQALGLTRATVVVVEGGADVPASGTLRRLRDNADRRRA